MTIMELHQKYSDERNELRAKHIEALKARLKEINLDGLVVKKEMAGLGGLLLHLMVLFVMLSFITEQNPVR